ncbi:hypothetical protein HMPREF3036_02356 [Sutterella sp. KLE1602]|nr:hypothetical protein HMPREF3036_02356 [Sutterella sp. KLE1602]
MHLLLIFHHRWVMNGLSSCPFFLLKSDRPQAFTGKRCGLGVLEGRKKGRKKRDPANTESLLLKASG